MRKIMLALLMGLFIGNLQAQKIVKYFVDMPNVYLPAFDKTLKLELIENFNKNRERDSVNNLFGQPSYLQLLDSVNNHLRIQSTSVSVFEMKVFTSIKDAPVIGIIHTVCGPVCSSYIRFYDENWQELAFEIPALENSDWLLDTVENSSKYSLSWLEKAKFIELRFAADNTEDILAINNTTGYLDEQVKVDLKSLMRTEPLRLKRSGNRFIKE